MEQGGEVSLLERRGSESRGCVWAEQAHGRYQEGQVREMAVRGFETRCKEAKAAAKDQSRMAGPYVETHAQC